MENLMGKLAEKLSAQEMIKANNAAEAAYRKQIEDQNKQYEQELELLRQNAQNMEKRLDDLKKEIVQRVDESDEATHDVGVRIYRNVQASVADEQKKQMDAIKADLDKQMDSIKEELNVMIEKMESLQSSTPKGNNNGILPLTVVILLASIANVVLLILRIIGLV
ncbi:MAG: hypothetical protein E7301_07565 [Butyrivibrio sp.]|nr:hypothetical protein [Butyrivibrio sp.]